jgi:hypothetical protein
MSTHELKPGDRVRVTRRYRGAAYQPGDKGTIWRGPQISAGGTVRYFYVTMDKDAPIHTTPYFTDEEIEPDM